MRDQSTIAETIHSQEGLVQSQSEQHPLDYETMGNPGEGTASFPPPPLDLGKNSAVIQRSSEEENSAPPNIVFRFPISLLNQRNRFTNPRGGMGSDNQLFDDVGSNQNGASNGGQHQGRNDQGSSTANSGHHCQEESQTASNHSLPNWPDNWKPESPKSEDANQWSHASQFPKVNPLDAVSNLPQGQAQGIDSKINLLKDNESVHDPKCTKVSQAKAAAADPQSGPSTRAKSAKVDAIHTGMNDDNQRPDPDAETSKQEIGDYINNYNFPEDPDRINIDAFSVGLNTSGVNAISGAKSTTNSLFGSISTPGADIIDLTIQDLPTVHEPALPTSPLELGTDILGDLGPDHLDFSGIDDAIEAELVEKADIGAAYEGDTSLFVQAFKEQYEALDENAGPEGFTKQDLQNKIAATETNLGTELGPGSEGLEAVQKTAMESQRTINLDNARQGQLDAKAAFERAKSNLMDDLAAEYNQANSTVTTEITSLQQKFSGEVNTQGLNGSNGLDGEIRAVINQFIADANNEYRILSKLDPTGIFPWDAYSAEIVRPTFITRLKDIIDKYEGYITTAVANCEAAINTAKTNIDTKVNAFNEAHGEIPADLQAAIDKIEADLEQLSDDVAAEADKFKNELITKRQAAIDEVDQYIADLRNAWANLFQDFLTLILEGGEAALRFLLKLFGINNVDDFIEELKSIGRLIGDIISDPIGFADHLIQAVTGAFSNYAQHLGENVQTIFTNWFFGDPDLELPRDLDSAESWTQFALDAVGINQDSLQEIIFPELNLPGGISIDPIAPLQALLTDGPSGLWDNLKTQLQDFPFIPPEGSEGEEETEASEADILSDVSQMTWESFLQEAQAFLPEGAVAQIENASYIYHQLASGEIPSLFEDLLAEMNDLGMDNILNLLIGEILDWVQTDLLPKLPLLLTSFLAPGGGIAKAIKAIYDGIIWCIDNKDQIWGVIQSIYASLSQIASGDISGAQATITAGINQGIALLLDLITTVVISSSPATKITGMLEKIGDNVKQAFERLMERIRLAFEGLMDAVQRFMGDRKAQGVRGTGAPQGREKDYQGANIPAADRIDSRTADLRGRVIGRAPISFTPPNYGSTYEDKVKTYRVLQALLDVYRQDDDKLSEGKISEADAKSLAAEIKNTHPVFKTFYVVHHSQTKFDPSFVIPEGEDYWTYEWSASGPKTAPSGKSKKQATIQRKMLDNTATSIQELAFMNIPQVGQTSYKEDQKFLDGVLKIISAQHFHVQNGTITEEAAKKALATATAKDAANGLHWPFSKGIVKKVKGNTLNLGAKTKTRYIDVDVTKDYFVYECEYQPSPTGTGTSNGSGGTGGGSGTGGSGGTLTFQIAGARAVDKDSTVLFQNVAEVYEAVKAYQATSDYLANVLPQYRYNLDERDPFPNQHGNPFNPREDQFAKDIWAVVKEKADGHLPTAREEISRLFPQQGNAFLVRLVRPDLKSRETELNGKYTDHVYTRVSDQLKKESEESSSSASGIDLNPELTVEPNETTGAFQENTRTLINNLSRTRTSTRYGATDKNLQGPHTLARVWGTSVRQEKWLEVFGNTGTSDFEVIKSKDLGSDEYKKKVDKLMVKVTSWYANDTVLMATNELKSALDAIDIAGTEAIMLKFNNDEHKIQTYQGNKIKGLNGKDMQKNKYIETQNGTHLGNHYQTLVTELNKYLKISKKTTQDQKDKENTYFQNFLGGYKARYIKISKLFRDAADTSTLKYDAYQEIETRLRGIFTYGQLLTEMHPFATSFTLKATKDELAGKGEKPAYDSLKELLANLSTDPTQQDPADLTELGNLIKKLVDDSSFQYVPDDFRNSNPQYSFANYLQQRIQGIIKLMGHEDLANRMQLQITNWDKKVGKKASPDWEIRFP